MGFNTLDNRLPPIRAKTTVTMLLLVAFNLIAWTWAWIAFANQPALLGTALLAYVFGLRHAFDADHIAAIDNVVRKLMQAGQASYAAGPFFSLGHSTVVVVASLLIAAMAAAAQDRLDAFHDVGAIIGTLVSTFFLLLIGLLNLLILKDVWSAFRRVQRGEQLAPLEVDGHLAGGGIIARLFRPMFRVVTRSWHMYPLGLLFGLGFDTATEVGLLAISASQAAQGAAPWNVMVFPALFTAGMTLMDTADSVLMTGAYRWAFLNPVRKLWYNMTITAASVAVAIFTGGMEALGLLANKFGFDGSFWKGVEEINGDLAGFGYAVMGIFAASWVVSAVIYRAKGYDKLHWDLS
jgi:high-affinity nickel-transport protein